MKRFFAVAVVLIVLFAAAAWGQQGPGPRRRGHAGRRTDVRSRQSRDRYRAGDEVKEFTSPQWHASGRGPDAEVGRQEHASCTWGPSSTSINRRSR